MMKFDVAGDAFTWAPRLSAQFSPDPLSSDNKFNIGSRWTVRGFDGETACLAIRDGTGAMILSGISRARPPILLWCRYWSYNGNEQYQRGKRFLAQ
jgi:hypothetical protein